jgi:hypothetical protein
MLKTNINNVIKLLVDLQPHIEPTIQAHMSMSSNHVTASPSKPGPHKLGQSQLSPQQQTQSNVLLFASRLLGNAEDLKKCAHAMKPSPSGAGNAALRQQQMSHTAQQQANINTQQQQTLGPAQAQSSQEETSAVQQIIASVTNMNVGPLNFEKLAFPIMRVRLFDEYACDHECASIGPDGNRIDCVYIPSKQRRQHVRERQQSLQSPTATASAASNPAVSHVGTVLFCPPNCGFFECLSQMPEKSSWLGYYTNLGFDVCLFNYRGYCQSEGGNST